MAASSLKQPDGVHAHCAITWHQGPGAGGNWHPPSLTMKEGTNERGGNECP